MFKVIEHLPRKTEALRFQRGARFATECVDVIASNTDGPCPIRLSVARIGVIAPRNLIWRELKNFSKTVDR